MPADKLPASSSPSSERMRLDKWLWAARFFKTRGLATEEAGKGRVSVNGVEAKASRDVKVGDMLAFRTGDLLRTVRVLGLSNTRGGAPAAQLLYEETAESLQARAAALEQRRLAPEPAHSLAHGRPSKRDRRALDDHQTRTTHDWDDRWSASLDD